MVGQWDGGFIAQRSCADRNSGAAISEPPDGQFLTAAPELHLAAISQIVVMGIYKRLYGGQGVHAMREHTPGPWQVWDRGFDNSPRLRVYRVEVQSKATSEFVAYLDDEDVNVDVVKLNAHLIAASPEMLGALKDGLFVFTQHDSTPEDKRLVLAKMAGAILKADGGMIVRDDLDYATGD